MKKISVILLCGLTTKLFAVGAPEATPKKPVVYVERVAKKSLSDQLTYPARVVPKVNATLLSEADGVVKKIVVPLGNKISVNSTVLVLNNTDPIYQYAPMRVRSPVSGYVSSVEVTEGSRVSKGQKLATVTDPSQLKITMEVAASDISALKNGMEGELELPGEDQAIKVRVSGVSPFVDPGTGTAPAELSVNSNKLSPLSLAPGMVGRVKFQVRMHEGYELPEFAVIYRGDQTLLRVVKDGKANMVTVSLGKTRHGVVEILKGLDEGNDVIVRSSEYVAEGEAVSIEKNQVGTP